MGWIRGRGGVGERVEGVATPSVTEAVKNTRFALAYTHVTVTSYTDVLWLVTSRNSPVRDVTGSLRVRLRMIACG